VSGSKRKNKGVCNFQKGNSHNTSLELLITYIRYLEDASFWAHPSTFGTTAGIKLLGDVKNLKDPLVSTIKKYRVVSGVTIFCFQ
jgi:hypothetical protein